MWKRGTLGNEIDVSKSSLVDLKAELFRRQAEYARDKADPTKRKSHQVNVKGKAKEQWAVEAKNRGVAARAARDQAMTHAEQNKAARSKAKLEEKAKLYDMMKARYMANESDTNESVLVDFEAKAWDNEASDIDSRSDASSDSDDDDVIAGRPLSERRDGEVWVEYEDDLGRTRHCPRSDFARVAEKLHRKIRRTEAAASSKADQYVYRSAEEQIRDSYQPISRSDRERSGSLEPKNNGPVYFQEVFGNEVRDLGVGYYGFSTDPIVRGTQMEALNKLREETKTLRQRSVSQGLRKQMALKKRLDKVRERKAARELRSGALAGVGLTWADGEVLEKEATS
ncbi:hypothetical protein SARC_03317 [Sphaeroforma arctica JP610]|uniref:CCDC174 alpha/beta GRSR domain-containing protein n=1 Tax=Sphaeroforma arctica JP610 TaxID=667725 RepID=A0A0L0G876_9EUKA|nr:hypothetical protein SARC_03317 [Sphaeroforma arctica JP610]KNC84453.1 hypothetical protein SARC_03317 [Sphaeroforma arctica JP610]|eukprot:XP_014158355.1 hypothetical protein SARC_03317 [Sphaeroforma arctica JP610]